MRLKSSSECLHLLILMDDKSNVVGQGFAQVRGVVGVINQDLEGQVDLSGTYYLIVGADNRNPGKQVLIDNVMVVGTSVPASAPLIRVGMGSYPFGSVAPYLVEPQ